MRKTIISLFFLFSFIFLNPQIEEIDSLIQLLNQPSLSLNEQIGIYRQISLKFYGYDLDQTIEYSKKGLALAEKEKDKENMAAFHHYIAGSYTYKEKFDSSLIHFEKGLPLAIEIKDKIREGGILADMGNLFRAQDQFEKSIEYYLKSLSVTEDVNKNLWARSLANIGIVYHILKNEERSIYYLNQARDVAEKEDMKYLKMGVYHAIGSYHFNQKEFEQALEFTNQSYKISLELDDKQYEIISLQNIALIYNEGYQEYDLALEYAEKVLKLAEEFNSPNKIVGAWNTLSNIYRNKKLYKESEAAAFKGWEIDSTSLNEATNLALNITLANIALGNKEKAETFFWKYHNLKDQHTEKTSHDSLLELGVKYETEKKEMLISSLEKEKELYLLLSIAGATILLLIIILLLIRHRMNVQMRNLTEQQRKINEQQIKELKQEKRLIATQAIMEGEAAERSRLARDLHDGLGGILSVIKLKLEALKEQVSPEENKAELVENAIGLLNQSIGELRRVAHHMMPASLMRHGLKVSLVDFCRAIPGTHFQYIGEDIRLDNPLEILIYRCAYELVNNAIKHSQATSIHIQLMIDKGIIALNVQDNGIGFNQKTINPGAGFENIRTRVSAYNGNINIYSSPGEGTEVSIEIELG